MAYKETDWFSCMTAPTRAGVYKTQHRSAAGPIIGYARFFMYGSRMVWSYTAGSIHAASKEHWASPQQSREWKGVLRDDVPS